MKHLKLYEDFYHYEGAIDDITVGQKVMYKDNEYEVIENTGERIDLKPNNSDDEIISVYHYDVHNIKTKN